jgi:prepilin-type N-terminal cleavage/methylation domain-containing protein
MITMRTALSHPFPPAGFQSRACAAARSRRGFSLIEILVVVALLSVIILGLIAMFHQTQKALLSTTTQVDILESGRAAADLVVRDFEQMTPSQIQNGTNFCVLFNTNAFLLQQNLADASELRSNQLEEVFFLTRNNLQWIGVGYFVETSTPPLNPGDTYVNTVQQFGIGSLYRYETNVSGPFLPVKLPSNPFSVTPAGLLGDYLWMRSLDRNTLLYPPPLIRVRKIVDGVVHFRIRAFDTQGRLLPTFGVTSPQYTKFPSPAELAALNLPLYYSMYSYSNAVPAYVELEMGVLQNRTLERFKTFSDNTDPTAARKFLAAHAAQVQLFRQRIPIRNVDPSAYPAFP